MTAPDALADYYRRRAAEYDRIYEKPERQEDLRRLEVDLADRVRGRRVLELACGTGWWTQTLARAADSVTATDANDEVLEIARRRTYERPVEFRRADAFRPESVPGRFDAIVAAFWVSHLPLRDLGPYVRDLLDAVPPGGRAVLLDNRYVEGSSTPVSRTDEEGNTYQTRRLDSGETFEVLKNFLAEPGFRRRVEAPGQAVRFRELEYFWIADVERELPL